MRIEASEEEFRALYERARAYYARCINSKENAFLQAETGLPLEAIAIRNAAVRIAFQQNITDDYWLEVELGLYASGSYMGKYTYSESKTGEAIEDGLVFY